MKILGFTSEDKLNEIILNKTDNIFSELAKLDSRNLKLIDKWVHDNSLLECYGNDIFTNGENINTHVLPPSDLTYILYGNIYLVYRINESIIDLDISQYGMIAYYISERYENLCISDNFSDISTDEEIEEKIEEKINDDNIKPKNKLSNITIADELDYDYTNY